MMELNRGNEEQLAKLVQAAENYEFLPNEALTKKLEELQNEISVIQEELAHRKVADQKKAWADAVDAIMNYCDKYGAITVEGDYNYDTVTIDITSDMDTSCTGLIEMG